MVIEMSEQNQKTEQSAIKKPNPNHPKKNSTIKVHPIRSLRDIKNIKKLLEDNPRNLAMFTFGINTNLRASDLLRITIGHVLHVQPEGKFTIREKKTGKLREIVVNKTVYASLQYLLKDMDTSDPGAYLFQSRVKKNGGKLSEEYLNALVKSWCREINIRENTGSHTLRKTFGFMHRTVFKTDIPTLMEMFNHSTQKQCLAYLGITSDEIQNAYLCEI